MSTRMSPGTPKVLVIVGPTGSGKTDLAVRIAKTFNGELIAADSRTVYRGMDIGTAKPQADSFTLQASPPLSPPPPTFRLGQADGRGSSRGGGPISTQGVPHWLLNIRHPDESYSVAEFKADAERCIREITERGHLPIVVGGTGLYIRALVDNLTIPGIPAQPKLRASFERKSNRELLVLLRKLDAHTARTIDRRNKRRIIRALEVCIFTGHPFSALRAKGAPSFAFLQIGISRSRAALYRRIDARIRTMFRAGLVEEVRQLLDRYGPSAEPLRGIIYREVVEYLLSKRGTTPNIHDRRIWGYPEQARIPHAVPRALPQRVMFANHRYARHQLMWFKRDDRIHWVRMPQQAERLVRGFLRRSDRGSERT